MKSPLASLMGEGPCFNLLISVAFVLLCVQPAWGSKPDSVPDWVSTAAHQQLPAYSIRRSGAFTLQANGTLSGAVSEQRFGDVAEVDRVYFSQRDAKEQRDYLDRTLSRDFTSFKIADVKVENAKLLNKPVDLSYAIEVDNFGRSSGTLMMFRPRVLGHEELHVDKKPRVVSIDLTETIEEIDDYTITLPSDYPVDDLPEPIKIDMGFASYESTSSMENHALHYRRKYTVRDITLPAEKYAEVQRLAGTIDADEQRRAVFKKIP